MDRFAELEAQKRWSELAKALELHAAEVGDRRERADLLARAMTLYRDRFANFAIAIALAERIVELDPHREDVAAFLREQREQRRR